MEADSRRRAYTKSAQSYPEIAQRRPTPCTAARDKDAMRHPLPRNPVPVLLPKRLRDDAWWLAPTGGASVIPFPKRPEPRPTFRGGQNP